MLALGLCWEEAGKLLGAAAQDRQPPRPGSSFLMGMAGFETSDISRM
jgi:hypothetical protein